MTMDLQRIENSLERFERYASGLDLRYYGDAKIVKKDMKGELNHSAFVAKLIIERKLRPSIEEIINLYFSELQPQIREYKRIEYNDLDENIFKCQLMARIYKGALGFLTELHAFILSSKFFYPNIVQRGQDRLGTDFVIYYNDKIYNIHVFIDRKDSWAFRAFKASNKNSDKLPGIHINVPYLCFINNFNKSFIHACRLLPNKFGVIKEKYLTYLKSEMDNGNVEKGIIIGAKEKFIYSNKYPVVLANN